MRRALLVSLAMLLLSATALADFGPQGWRWRAKLDTGDRAGIVSAEIGVSSPLWNQAQPDLADLRIADETGQEVPYVLWRPEPASAASRVPASLINVGRTTDGSPAATATLDFGGQAPTLTGLVLELGGPSRFMRQVILQGSHDQQAWTELATPDYVYDLSEQGGARSTHLRITHPARFRYVRVLIPDMGFEPLTIVSGTGETAAPAALPLQDVYAGKPTLSRVGQDKTSTHIIDLGAARPLRELTIAAGVKNYHRAISVEGSEDGNAWRPLGTGVVYNYDVQGRTGSNPPVRFQECVCRHLRLTIRDGDDKPLPVTGVTLRGLPAGLLFEARQGAQYWVFAGNPGAERPSYDLAHLPVSPQDAPSIRPEFSEQNPDYAGPVDGKPWTERHPWILWTALGLAVLAAGTGVVRVARAMVSGQSGED